MKQDIVNQALNIIQSRKRQAEFEYQQKLAPLYKNEEFTTLEKAYTKLVIENAKKESLGENFDKNAIKTLENAIKKIKNSVNLPLLPNYSCKICHDEGYKNGEMCTCLKKEISTILLKESGFSKLQDFESSFSGSGELLPIYKKMQQWCNSNFEKNLIYLAGPTGAGKTHLLCCMANELIERGKVVKLCTAFKMNQDFKEFSKTMNDEVLQKYLDCEVLFIDDLGTEPIYKNVTLEYLYVVINERKMRKLSTVITSNLDLDDLKNRYEERICSRIVDRATSITLYLGGEDKRLKTSKKS